MAERFQHRRYWHPGEVGWEELWAAKEGWFLESLGCRERHSISCRVSSCLEGLYTGWLGLRLDMMMGVRESMKTLKVQLCASFRLWFWSSILKLRKTKPHWTLNVVQLGLEVPICHSSLKDVEDQVHDKPQHPIDSTTINLAWFSRCHCMQTAVWENEVINNSFYIWVTFFISLFPWDYAGRADYLIDL